MSNTDLFNLIGQPSKPPRDDRKQTLSGNVNIRFGSMFIQSGTVQSNLTQELVLISNPEPLENPVPANPEDSLSSIYVVEGEPNKLYYTDSNQTEQLINKPFADLFTTLDAGNVTNGLNVNFTGGSEIISSDGDIMFSALLSAGSLGDIFFKPKASGFIDVQGQVRLTGVSREINLISGASIISDDADITLDTLASTATGDIIFRPKNLLQIFSDTTITGGAHTVDLQSPSPIVSSNANIDFDNTASTGTPGDINLRPKGDINFFSGTSGIVMQPTGNSIDFLSSSSLVSLDGNVILDASSSIGDGNVVLRPKDPSANVSVIGDLDISGATSIINSSEVNIADNCIYLNNGFTATSPVSGGLMVNFLATANVSSVAVGGFTAGPGSGSGPVVETDNAYPGWITGDIIQISGASDASNNGIFEVESYSNPTLTIRGVGGTSISFNCFQNDFVTDATIVGSIRQVNITILSSGSDGNWEISPGFSNSTGVTFDKIAPRLNSSGIGTHSVIFAPIASTIKTVSDGTDVTITDSGTGDLTIDATGGGIGSTYQEAAGLITPILASVNSIMSGTLNLMNSFVTNSQIEGSSSCDILGTGVVIVDNNAIFASSSSDIRISGIDNLNSIFSSSSSLIGGVGGGVSAGKARNNIQSGLSCTIYRTLDCRIISSSGSRILGGTISASNHLIISSLNCDFLKSTTSVTYPGGSIISCVTSDQGTTTANTGRRTSFISCNTATSTLDCRECTISSSLNSRLVNQPVNSGIMSCDNCDMIEIGAFTLNRNHMIASVNSNIRITSGTGYNNNAIVASLACESYGIRGVILSCNNVDINSPTPSNCFTSTSQNAFLLDSQRCALFASNLSRILSDAQQGLIVATTNCDISIADYCMVEASTNCDISNVTARNICTIASINCDSTSLDDHYVSMVSSNACTHVNSDQGSIWTSNSISVLGGTTHNAVMNSFNCRTRNSTNSIMFSCDSCDYLSSPGNPLTRYASSISAENGDMPGTGIGSEYVSTISSNSTFQQNNDYGLDCSSFDPRIVACNYASIYTSNVCNINNANNCTINTSTSSQHQSTGTLGSSTYCFMASSNSTFSTTVSIRGADYKSIMSNDSSSYGLLATKSAYTSHISGTGNSNSGGAPGDYTTSIGSNISLRFDNNFYFSDNAGGTSLTSTTTDEFLARASGGSAFYSNTLNTTGVTLGAGLSAWAVVSDKTLKENFMLYDLDESLAVMKNVPVYSYNFKGNDPKQKNIGTVAQDWNREVNKSIFVTKGDIDYIIKGGVKSNIDENKTINQGDLLGVMMASIKKLIEKKAILEEKLNFIKTLNI